MSKRNKKSMRYANASGVGVRRVVNSGYGDFGASHSKQTFVKFSARSLSPSRDIYRNLATLRSRSRSLYMSAPVATSAIKSLRTAVVGRVVAYHVASDYPCNGGVIEWARVEKFGKSSGAPNILHLMDAERPGQLRGVPFIAPILESIMQLGQYLRSEALAALMETYLSGYITTEATDAPIVGATRGMAPAGILSEDGEGAEEEVSRDLAELEPQPGMVHQLLPGEKITFNDPKRPGTQFDPFVRSVAMQIGAALEIPADVLLKSYNSSYSASRAAIQDFWRMVSMTRDWFASDFCGAVYAEWLSEAVATGRIEAPGFFSDPRRRRAWLGHEWTGAAMPHLDPVKEASAMKAMTENGWLTHQQATTLLNGGDWNVNIAQLKDEVAKLAAVKGILDAAATIKQNDTPTTHE